MADYTITPSAVLTTATLSGGTAGEAIDAGEAVYLKSSDGKLYLGQADGTEAEATVKGIAVNSAEAAGQPVSYLPSGELTVDAATFTVGALVFLSETAGKLCPESDLTSDSYKSLIGYATAANKLQVSLLNTGTQVPAA